MAAADQPDIKEKLLKGYKAGDKNFRVHMDGYNQLPYLKGEVDESPRHEFFYYGETDLFAIRYNNWKVHFQTKDDWFKGQIAKPTMPQPVNLRLDPFEHAMKAPNYPTYVGEKLWTILPAGAILKKYLDSFDEFPMRQTPKGFNPKAVMEHVWKTAADRHGN